MSKTSSGENFPVGSMLLPAEARPQVAAFYRFARVADDVADDPGLSPDEKVALLDGMDAALRGESVSTPRSQPATALRRTLLEKGITVEQPRALLVAFRRDALRNQCADWDDLMDYCRYSAAPVGRFLIEVHGEDETPVGASDALCAALQVLNHIQDARADFLNLDRVYVPADWLAEEGLDRSVLGGAGGDAALMRVFSRMLDGVDALLSTAAPLAGRMTCRGLRLESAVIVTLAGRLAAKLRGRDPIAGFIGLKWHDWAYCVPLGLMRGLRAGRTGSQR
ncbi:MAG: squalene/phytoene synthase family protein [Alphaproteobacteria bacterium]|nr:squalene/phytoene synthase family protein [Alphaproteobacteria bacterium]MBF0128380.1 squalene/phytoene synthase family protein [Alphaproteobacteria bacterium]